MVKLTKGQKVSLTKEAPSLDKMIVGLGWDVNARKGLFGGHDYDLDAFIIGCRNDKFVNNDDLVFFGNKNGCGGAVTHTGDNLTGEGDGDDEQIIVELSRVPADINKLVVCVDIYQASKRDQDFGQVENAFVRICDANNGTEVLRYDLTENYSGFRGMIFGEIYRHNNEWKFNPIGQGTKEETVTDIARLYR